MHPLFKKDDQFEPKENEIVNIDSLETLEIPLNKLLPWNENVRTIEPEEDIGELAASITSVGLLENLVVMKQPRGKYAVIAGRRRFLALSQLACDGTLKQTFPVPCRVAPEGADLTEIGLAENVVRKPMHPLEEFQAFLKLIDEGNSVADVAARFGVTEAVVNRRLALARVSPVLLEKYRAGELNLELLQAFTLTDDYTAQEAVWEHLQPWDRKPQAVRSMLSDEDIPATDKRVRFVGLDTYEAEGGAVRCDLFAEGEEGVYVSDHTMLARLVGAKFQSIAQGLQADGWKWVAIHPETDYQALGKFKRLPPTLVPLPNSTLNKLRNLEQKRAKLQAQLDESDEEDAHLYSRIDELEQTIDAIYNQQTSIYDDNTKARCGVVVSIGSDGEPQLFYGLLRKEDESALPHSEDGGDTSTIETVADDNAEESSAYPATLIESLTQTKTAAIAAELSQQPNIALAALVHALVLSEFGLDLHLYGAKSSLQVSSHEANLAGAAGSPALAMLDQKKLDWAKEFPTTPDGLWLWCLERPQETLLELLAYCVARTVHGVQSKMDSNPSRLRHTDALARALRCDIAKWFTPTAENFFLRVSKAKISEAFTEAGKSPAADISKYKKAQLAALAETEINGTGWLPGPARVCGSND